MSLEQHLYEFKRDYKLEEGKYDISDYIKWLSIESPSLSASPVAKMVDDLETDYNKAFDRFWEIHHSWFADLLFDWNNDLYRQPCKFLLYCYKNGYVDYDEYPSL